MKRTANLITQHLFWRGLYFSSILVLNILIARFFAAEKSGQIFYITNNLAFLILLASMCLESGAVYFISLEKADALKMGRFFLLWTLIAGTFAVLAWWLILQFSGMSAFPKLFYAGILFIGGVLLTTFFNALFYSKQQFGLPNKILFGVNVIFIVFLIFGSQLPWIRENFLFLYFFSYFFQGFLLILTFFFRYSKKENQGLPAISILKKVYAYSAAALISNIAYFLVNRMDYWLVERYCSANDLGNYIQASKLGQLMLIIPSILAATLFPLLATGKEMNANTKLESVVRILFSANLVFCLPIVCFGNYLFPLVFGSSFDKMYILFVLLIPGILALSMNYPVAAWFSAKDRIRVNISGALIALIFIFISDILILPRTGVFAASAVSSIGYFCFYFYLLTQYRKENPSYIKDFFMIRKNDLQWILQLLKAKISGISPERTIDA
jgi:O-antigen/teichoic acid export membrane protein